MELESSSRTSGVASARKALGTRLMSASASFENTATDPLAFMSASVERFTAPQPR